METTGGWSYSLHAMTKLFTLVNDVIKQMWVSSESTAGTGELIPTMDVWEEEEEEYMLEVVDEEEEDKEEQDREQSFQIKFNQISADCLWAPTLGDSEKR